MAVEQRIQKFIQSNYYVPESIGLGPDTSLLDQGIIDSTGVLELIAFLEKEFALRVEDAEMVPDNLDSIGRISAFVTRKQLVGSSSVVP